MRCSRGHDRMVVTTTYAISAYHHSCCEFESRSGRDVQHYVIKLESLELPFIYRLKLYVLFNI
jgi:hypothetical protein